jgi:LysR family transcriptional regulator, cys regulon transcriptional activator
MSEKVCAVNHQQLRFICEVAHQGLNISKAATALNTSQPGISKQIKLLEAELGIEIFERTRNRVSGVTQAGKRVIALAQDVVSQISRIRSVARDLDLGGSGSLIVATSHTQARYLLPEIMQRFISRYPKVTLTLRHANPQQIADMLLAGEADLGITTETQRSEQGLLFLPCRRYERVLIVPVGHKLLQLPRVTLADIAEYPMIAYEAAFTGRHLVSRAFDRAGISPKLILSAIDADVIKTCVEQGLGIAILSEIVFRPARDTALRAIPVGHLVEPAFTSIAMRRQRQLRVYEYDFISICSPNWTPSKVDRAAAVAHEGRPTRVRSQASTSKRPSKETGTDT